MKRIILISFLVIAMFTIMASPVMAAAPPYNDPDDAPTIESKKVYRNLLETGDRLVVIYANIPYADLPVDPITDVFIWQFLDNDGVTVLGSTVGYTYNDNGFNYNVFSMYWPATETFTWNPTPSYKLKLVGNPLVFVVPPSYLYTINPADYTSFTDSDDVKTELTADILAIATDLDIKWGLSYSLLYNDDAGTTLSTYGQTFFRGAIYGLQSMAPALFPLAVRQIDIEARTWDNTYEVELRDQWAGTWIETAREAGKVFFGTDYDLTTIIIMLLILIGVVIANLAVTAGDYMLGLVDCAFVLVIFAKLGFYDLGVLGLICAICILYTGVKIWGVIRL